MGQQQQISTMQNNEHNRGLIDGMNELNNSWNLFGNNFCSTGDFTSAT